VGVSQRHSGKWDEGKYRLELDYYHIINLRFNNVEIDGLQVANTASTGNIRRGIFSEDSLENVSISNCIVRKINSAGSTYGIVITGNDSKNATIYNNIVYDFTGAINDDLGIYVRAEDLNNPSMIYSNTVYNCGRKGIEVRGGQVIIKNNIAQGSVDGYSGSFHASSDYNISDIEGDAPNANFDGGFATVQFKDAANYDFHLSPNDTAALGKGTDLSTDTNLSFSTDIDGEPRSRWDIGADEMTKSQFKLEGSFQMEGYMRFE
jgi:hypothetical protein